MLTFGVTFGAAACLRRWHMLRRWFELICRICRNRIDLLAPGQPQVVEIGAGKADLPLGKLVLMGLLAGVYVGLGGLLMLNIGISCPGLAQVKTAAGKTTARP